MAVFISCATPPNTTGSAAAQEQSPPILSTSEIYGLLTWDNMMLFNNSWGAVYIQHKELASSTVSYDPAARVCAWRWSWPKEAVSELKGYPCLTVGDKVWAPPGFDSSTDPRFPLHLPLMESLWVTGEFSASGNGAYDLSFDLAFLNGKNSYPDAMRSEIMVWLKAPIACPAKKIKECLIDGRAYDFHVNTDWNPRSPYLAFVLKSGTPPQRLPLHEFIRMGIREGYVDPGAYLAAVELGPEIWWGAGEAAVRNYGISINGE